MGVCVNRAAGAVIGREDLVVDLITQAWLLDSKFLNKLKSSLVGQQFGVDCLVAVNIVVW